MSSEAFAFIQETARMGKADNVMRLQLAGRLCEIKDNELWRDAGYMTFRECVASMGLGYTYATASRYMGLYRRLVRMQPIFARVDASRRERGVEDKDMDGNPVPLSERYLTASTYNLFRLTPVLERLSNNIHAVEQWMLAGLELPRGELVQALREAGLARPTERDFIVVSDPKAISVVRAYHIEDVNGAVVISGRVLRGNVPAAEVCI